MTFIFEVDDKSGRKIHLTKERWSHIKKKHYEVENYEIIEETIKKPDKITQPYEGTKYYYFKYYKHREFPDKYLMVIC